MTLTGFGRVGDNNFGVADFIVDGGGLSRGATHTTIAAALASASSGDSIFIRPGTYTENLTMKAGVNMTGFQCDSGGQVTIVGKLSCSYSGSVTLTGLSLHTNGAFAIELTGANATLLTLDSCSIYADDATAISSTGSGGASVAITNCAMFTSTTGVAYFAFTNGTLYIRETISSNAGASTTANTFSGTQLTLRTSYLGLPLTTSGTSNLVLFDTEFESGATNSTSLTHGSTGSICRADYCNFRSGTATPISIGAGATLTTNNISAHHTNATAVTGAGTIVLNSLEQTNTVGAVSSTGVTEKVVRMGGINFGDENLSEYNEGTWTPTIGAASGTITTLTYTTQDGTYIRVGNLVWVHASIVVNAFTIGTGSGNLQLESLPFTVKNTANNPNAALFSGGLNWGSGSQVTAQFQPNTTIAAIIECGDNIAATVTAISGLAAGDSIKYSGCYQI